MEEENCGVVKFYKCRTQMISEVVEDTLDPGDDYWGKIDLSTKKEEIDEYTTYTGTHDKEDFNLLPTRSYVYASINGKTYGKLIRHELLMNVKPKLSYNGYFVVNIDEVLDIDMEEWSNLPEKRWLQFGKRGDKIIFQIEISKVNPIATNRDDLLGELYLYSIIKIIVHVLD